MSNEIEAYKQKIKQLEKEIADRDTQLDSYAEQLGDLENDLELRKGQLENIARAELERQVELMCDEARASGVSEDKISEMKQTVNSPEKLEFAKKMLGLTLQKGTATGQVSLPPPARGNPTEDEVMRFIDNLYRQIRDEEMRVKMGRGDIKKLEMLMEQKKGLFKAWLDKWSEMTPEGRRKLISFPATWRCGHCKIMNFGVNKCIKCGYPNPSSFPQI